MKEFKTLEEVKTAIEKWFIDLGFNNPERAEKQYLKIISEVGEMADALCKDDLENFKSEAGDVFVTIVGYCLQKKENLIFRSNDYLAYKLITMLKFLISNIEEEDFELSINWLDDICISKNTTLLECATIAYNKIEQRRVNGQLKVINGTIQK